MLLSRTVRVGLLTAALLATMLAFEAGAATTHGDVSCAAAQARMSALEARLAKVHEHIDVRNARIADAGHDLNRINGWESGLTHARQHEDRIRERMAAVTKRCQG